MGFEPQIRKIIEQIRVSVCSLQLWFHETWVCHMHNVLDRIFVQRRYVCDMQLCAYLLNCLTQTPQIKLNVTYFCIKCE
jgi:hypothetical protein